MVEEMKPREGYKKTEVGVIPEDWSTLKVKDVMSFSGGSQPPKHTFINERKLGYIRLIQIRDYKSDKFITFIPEELANKKCNEDDVMIGRYGPPIFQILRGIEGAYNVALIKTIPSELIKREYLYYFLKQESLFNFIELLSRRSSGQTGVDIVALKEYPINLPSLKEQGIISKALNDTDNLIQSIEKLIDKKEKIKKGTMQELLTGKKRLDGFSGEWEQIKLGKVGNCIRGVTYKTEEDLQLFDSKNTVRLLRSNNILDNRILFENMHIVNDLKVKDNQILKEEDIVICMANGSKSLVGKSGIFKSYDKERYTVGAFMSVYRVNTNLVLNEFISFYLQTNDYRNYINVLLAGSSINNLNPSDIESIDINVPQLNEQKAILNILSDMDLEIDSLKQKLEKYKIIKQGMMQELLTGGIRLI